MSSDNGLRIVNLISPPSLGKLIFGPGPPLRHKPLHHGSQLLSVIAVNTVDVSEEIVVCGTDNETIVLAHGMALI